MKHKNFHGIKFSTIAIVSVLTLFSVLALFPGPGFFPIPEAEAANAPPDFGDAYTIPETEVPEPPSGILNYLDVAILALALILSSYFSLKKRSRNSIFLLSVFSLLYFGFFRTGCVCSIGSIQNVVLSLFDNFYSASVTVLLFFSLPLIFTLFFGRSFCGAVCPLGAIQDVVLLRPTKVPFLLQSALGLLPYIYLGAAILLAATGSAFLICRYDPFVAFFRCSGSFNMIVLGISFLLISVFVGRPYCRFLCPYGALLNLFSRVSKWRVTITPAECVQCRLCEDSCPFGALQPSTRSEQPVSRSSGKWRLAFLCLMLPVLVTLGGYSGKELSVPLSRTNTTVQLAERIFLEDSGKVNDTTDASDAFRDSGREAKDLFDDARKIQEQFDIGALILGCFAGLVTGLKLISLSIRRKRDDYEADRGLCVSCGRCFSYCPVEKQRLKDLK